MTRKKHHTPAQTPSGATLVQSALQSYRPLLSEEEFSALQAELQRPLRSALRLNPLKATVERDLPQWAERYGWSLRPIPYCSQGFWVETAETPISQTPEHALGFYYIQDGASMLPVELFDLPAEPLILDLAASPGGKTTHLVAKTGDRGLVLANDASRSRLTALRIVLNNWGASSVAITNFPGESFGSWFADTFDAVLLDAPCSMENLRPTDHHPMRPISARERSNLAERQARLLRSALRAVRLGGQVVYSTCTLAAEEDEGVLATVLNELGSAVQLDELTQRLPAPAPGLTHNGNELYDPLIQRAVRLWPHRFGTSGFFAARLTRTGPLPAVPRPTPLPSRPIHGTGWQELNPIAQNGLRAAFQEHYGFDLSAALDELHCQIWQWGKTYHAIPQNYLARFASLPVHAVGLPIGEETSDGLLPAQEWISRFVNRFEGGRYCLSIAEFEAGLRGHPLPYDPSRASNACPFPIIFDETGRLLGRASLQAGFIKPLRR
jgi:16S rRNA (cytosine1407-C5)-methyltransferase